MALLLLIACIKSVIVIYLAYKLIHLVEYLLGTFSSKYNAFEVLLVLLFLIVLTIYFFEEVTSRYTVNVCNYPLMESK